MRRNIENSGGIACAAGLLVALGACNVDENSPEPRGVSLPGDDTTDAPPRDAGAMHDAATERRRAPRGFYVVHSDFDNSAVVSAVGVDGEVLSHTLLASGQAGAGLSFDVGSDLVLPSSAQTGDEVVVIDRTNQVIDWVELKSARVVRQLNVGPGGFAASPYDYVPHRSDKAYVTRHNTNLNPGKAEFDEGGDLLIIDPSEPEIIGRIDLADTTGDEALLPRPDSALAENGALYVMVVAIDADFSRYGESKLVTVDPDDDAVVDVLSIDDMVNCGELVSSPDGRRLAVGCAGDWSDPLASSGITVVDISGAAPVLEAQYFADDLGDVQLSTLSFVSDDVLLFTSYGSFEDGTGDALLRLDLGSGEVDGEPLFETQSAFGLWSLRCEPEHQVCVLADSESEGGTLHRLLLDDGQVDSIEPVEYADGIGMPPRNIGVF